VYACLFEISVCCIPTSSMYVGTGTCWYFRSLNITSIMPQLDTVSYFSQIHWVFCFYITLYVALLYILLPRFIVAMKTRKRIAKLRKPSPYSYPLYNIEQKMKGNASSSSLFNVFDIYTEPVYASQVKLAQTTKRYFVWDYLVTLGFGQITDPFAMRTESLLSSARYASAEKSARQAQPIIAGDHVDSSRIVSASTKSYSLGSFSLSY
jgi:hypothetical protein